MSNIENLISALSSGQRAVTYLVAALACSAREESETLRRTKIIAARDCLLDAAEFARRWLEPLAEPCKHVWITEVHDYNRSTQMCTKCGVIQEGKE